MNALGKFFFFMTVINKNNVLTAQNLIIISRDIAGKWKLRLMGNGP